MIFNDNWTYDLLNFHLPVVFYRTLSYVDLVIILFLTIRITYKTNGTAQGPHISSSYVPLALTLYDSKAVVPDLSPITWKRLPNDSFLV